MPHALMIGEVVPGTSCRTRSRQDNDAWEDGAVVHGAAASVSRHGMRRGGSGSSGSVAGGADGGLASGPAV